jgi:hypothetical protein
MLSQKEYRRLKSNLTRAINSGDPEKILATVTAAREQFEREGFPDYWPRWRNAASDIAFRRYEGMEYESQQALRDKARAEEDRWF